MLNRLHRESYDYLEWGGYRFGSLGGNTSSSQEQTKPSDLTPAEYEALRGPFAALLAGLTGATKPLQGEQARPGEENVYSTITPNQAPLAGIPKAPEELLRVAQIGPAERRALQAVQQSAGHPLLAQTLNQTLRGKFLPGQEGANPFLQAAIEAAQRPTLEGLTETLSRELPGRFTQGGQFIQPRGSSAFDRAAAIASRGAANALGDIATNISAGAYETERNRQLQATQQKLQFTQQEFDQGLQRLQAAGLPRLIKQAGIDKGLAEFQRQIGSLTQILAIIQGVTPPTNAPFGEGSSSSFGFSSSGGIGLGGGGGGGG